MAFRAEAEAGPGPGRAPERIGDHMNGMFRGCTHAEAVEAYRDRGVDEVWAEVLVLVKHWRRARGPAR